MRITLAEAVDKARADGGRLVHEEPTGERTEVGMPEPSGDGDWGPAHLDAPYIPPLSGVRVPPECPARQPVPVQADRHRRF